MDSQNSPLERSRNVREEFFEKLGLNLTDEEVNILLEGDLLSIEKLMESHTLKEVGTALISWDALTQARNCPPDEVYIWPFGCFPLDRLDAPKGFRLPSDF